MDFKPGFLHVSKDVNRGFVENDPVLELDNRKKEHFEHGIYDVRSNVARAAYDAGMLNLPLIQEIIKK
jgi:hypothetical protein